MMRGNAVRPIGAVAMAAAALVVFSAEVAWGSSLPKGLVYLRDIDPSIVQDMRYAGRHNFVGRPIDGYDAAECVLSRRAAEALSHAQAALKPQNLSLKVYDCYRPVRAVRNFTRWARDRDDRVTKPEFYPLLDKQDLFRLGYIASRSSHSRGSAVDLAIVPLPVPPQPPVDLSKLKGCYLPRAERYADNSLDFGTGFDCFHARSHTHHPGITGTARRNRELLVKVMRDAGFRNYRNEWWHFQLVDEPFPRTYFDAPIRSRRADAATSPGGKGAPPPLSVSRAKPAAKPVAPVSKAPAKRVD